MMRIGIDCRTILNPKGEGELAGVGHYTYYLVKHLLELPTDDEFVLFFDHRMRGEEVFRKPHVFLHRFPFMKYKRALPIIASHLLVPAILRSGRLDVFHGPANILPLFYFGPSVVTMHDFAIYRQPEWFPPGQQFTTRLLIPSSLRRASHVVAVSESTQNDLQRIFRVPSSRITMIHEGIEKILLMNSETKQRLMKRFRLSHAYLLFVGTLEPRKNLQRLVRSFNQLIDDQEVRKRFPELQLVIAGAKGMNHQNLFQTIRSLPHRFRIKIVGYVSREEKYALYQSAQLFVFPSLWEGFGLPVLEAMACGTPVLSSLVSALPEVLGKAGIGVNPMNEREMTRGMKKILLLNHHDRAKMIEAGRNQIKRFQWEDTAAKTLEVYHRVGMAKFQKDIQKKEVLK